MSVCILWARLWQLTDQSFPTDQPTHFLTHSFPLTDVDEAPYDRTYTDRSNDVVPEKKNFNAGKYGLRTKKKVEEPSDDETDEGRNPWEKTKKIVGQSRQKEEESDDDASVIRKPAFTTARPRTAGGGTGTGRSTPTQSDVERDRSGVEPKNPFLHSKADNYRKARGAMGRGADSGMESTDDVLAKLRTNKSHVEGA